jgi:hypothetical protein
MRGLLLFYRTISGFAVAAEYVHDFVTIEFLHVVASGAEVLARVEFRRLLSEYAANGSGHSQTAVGVDVDFANGALCSFAKLFFGDTDSVGELAAEHVDSVNFFLGNRRRAVEYDREAGKLGHNSVEDVESQGRGNELAFFVAGALLGSELVSTVGSADRDSEGVAAGAGSEVDNLFGVGVGVVVGRNFVFNAGENAELTFYSYVVLVSVFYNLLGKSYVFFVGEVRTINHDRREARVDAAFAEFEAVAVVEVEHNLGIFPAEFLGIFYSTLSHVTEEGCVCVVAGAFGYLKDNGRFFFRSSLDDSLELLHVVEVESGDCIAAFDSLCKHLAGVYEAEFFITYHFKQIYCWVLCS